MDSRPTVADRASTPPAIEPSVAELLARSAARLSARSPTPRLDAELLLGHCLSRPRSWLFAHGESIPHGDERRAFSILVDRRLRGEPLAYLTGTREFWSLTLEVGPGALIPRPETEGLVEHALELSTDEEARIADLGTGTGAIAIAIGVERPKWRITATDVSSEALAIARRNADRLVGGDRIDFRRGDWCAALADTDYDLIVSNPPYVADDDPRLAADVAAHEPALALFSGPSGLECLEEIARQARGHLRNGGWLLLEHGPGQALALKRHLERLGYQMIGLHRDLAGLSRIVSARWGRR